MKRKQTSIDILVKLRIIEQVDRAEKSKTQIDKDFNTQKSTLSTILSQRENLYAALASGTVNPAKKLLNHVTLRLKF